MIGVTIPTIVKITLNPAPISTSSSSPNESFKLASSLLDPLVVLLPLFITPVATNKKLPPLKTKIIPVHQLKSPPCPSPVPDSSPSKFNKPNVINAPIGAAKQNASNDFLIKLFELEGEERRSVESANAVGALCSMMARKMIRSNDLVATGEEEEEEIDEAPSNQQD